jgi:hypothetical protein
MEEIRTYPSLEYSLLDSNVAITSGNLFIRRSFST